MSEEWSGPHDGPETKLDLMPGHQKQAAKQDGKFLDTLLTGGVVIGGIVGLYLLWKHFFGKEERKNADENEGRQTRSRENSRLRKRTIAYSEANEKLSGLYAGALANEEFLEFLETFVESEDFDTVLLAVTGGE